MSTIIVSLKCIAGLSYFLLPTENTASLSFMTLCLQKSSIILQKSKPTVIQTKCEKHYTHE